MKIAIVYVYPMVHVRTYFSLAKRFADTWRKFPPQIDHELHVICNGGEPTHNDKAVFIGIPCTFHVYGNIGWDIGAYQWAGESLPCDLLVCMGSHCNFHRHGWLDRMADVYMQHGPNLFGCRGYYYAGSHHIRTTCFWIPPVLLNSYPESVGNTRPSRYRFEHSKDSITEWVEKAGFKALGVTWDGVFDRYAWPDCFGPAETALVYDQWTHQPNSGPHDR